MRHMNVDIGFLTETKLFHTKYTRDCEGYQVFATRSDRFQGGVALFYRNTAQWTVEGIKAFGPNVLRCSLVSGNRRWTCLGVYIPPSEFASGDGDTLRWIEQATANVVDPLILMGDLNCNPVSPSNSYGDDISTALSLLGLTDVADHFTHPRGRWTWSQWRSGRYIRSTTDFVYAQLPLDFSRWVIKIPRYNSDHRAIVTELGLSRFARSAHRRYLAQRKYPVRSIRPLRRIDQLFENLCGFIPLPPRQPLRDSSWISEVTWRLIDERAALVRRHRFHHHVDDEPVAKRTRLQYISAPRSFLAGWCREDCTQRLRILSRRIQAALRLDRRRRAARVGLEAEAYLASGDIHQAYHTISWMVSRSPESPV